MKELNFNERATENEFLDQKEIDVNELIKNLNEFVTLNKYLGTKNDLLKALDKIYPKYKEYVSNKKISILDLGCGAGDLLIAMNDWANKKNINIDLIGIDNNQTIVDFAKQNIERMENAEKYKNISIKNMDIISFLQEINNVDIVCLNNVLHHFKDEQIIELLQGLSIKTNLAIIINDLRREPIAYYGIKWIAKLCNMSTLAQNDGPLSVRKSFREEDFRRYFKSLNLHDFEIHKAFAFRWQVIIFLHPTIVGQR